jgi:hypothetical protein
MILHRPSADGPGKSATALLARLLGWMSSLIPVR